jgi:hypothetical protein
MFIERIYICDYNFFLSLPLIYSKLKYITLENSMIEDKILFGNFSKFPNLTSIDIINCSFKNSLKFNLSLFPCLKIINIKNGLNSISFINMEFITEYNLHTRFYSFNIFDTILFSNSFYNFTVDIIEITLIKTVIKRNSLGFVNKKRKFLSIEF